MLELTSIVSFLLIIITPLLIFTLRVLVIVLSKNPLKRNGLMKTSSAKTLIVMGSGGHTGEMMRLLSSLDFCKYSPRIYIVAETDTTSSDKVKQRENSETLRAYTIAKIPRSREVHQPWLSTVVSTLKALRRSFAVVLQEKPDLILCNGPGTCVPICLAGFLLKVFGIGNPSIIFVESICRVKSLSLTGKIMLVLADSVIVQWPELQAGYPSTVYLGALV